MAIFKRILAALSLRPPYQIVGWPRDNAKHRHARATAAIRLLILMSLCLAIAAPAAYGLSIQLQSSADGPNCFESESSTITSYIPASSPLPSVSSNCFGSGGFSGAAASGAAYGAFDISLSAESEPSSSTANASASATATEDNTFTVVGGTGPATLVLNFQLSGQGAQDPDFGEIIESFTVDVNGTQVLFASCPFNPNTYRYDCSTFTAPFTTFTVSTPVSFGTPFDISDKLFLTSGAVAGGGIQTLLAGSSVLDQNGQQIKGASLFLMPEPSSSVLVGLGLTALLVLGRSKMRRTRA